MKHIQKFAAIGITDFGLWRMRRELSLLLDLKISSPFFIKNKDEIAAYIGWGMKPSGIEARRKSKRNNRPCLLLEDGFLRSIDLGVQGAPPLSLIVDDVGIYYDSSAPSRLEKLIAEIKLTETQKQEAQKAISLIKEHSLSKYNNAPDKVMAPTDRLRILVVDQTYNDASILYAGATPKTFQDMLECALKENPEAEILIKTHPDVLAGKKKAHFEKSKTNSRIHFFSENISSLSLIKQVEKVYVVSSQMGFEALLLNKPVVCFGMPWYAGWGLTDDRHIKMPELKKRRHTSKTFEEIFYASYFQYHRYINPCSNRQGTIFDVINYLALNKKLNNQLPKEIYGVGMSPWKRAVVKPFLTAPETKLHYVSSPHQVPAQKTMVSWGIRQDDSPHTPHWRMEDGFLRSVGLGSDLNRPISLVVDKGGIYYNPNSNSDIQQILETQKLTEEQIERVKSFKTAFVSQRMSKYNLAQGTLETPRGRNKVILVPGQVEDDASIQLGSLVLTTNLALLETVRKLNPDAYILYKPHPDVVAGNRRGAIPEKKMAELANQVVTNANVIDCIQHAEEIHTMTSLTGFEALLHGKKVHCYGGPFYAGRGLTVDHFPLPQRKRKVTLEEMIHATFFEYPRYVLPGVKGFVSAENALNWLVLQSQKHSQKTFSTGIKGWFERKGRKIKALKELYF